ncbi:unnamed protein product, partial [Ectocarpus sp. 4 AP-2014]
AEGTRGLNDESRAGAVCLSQVASGEKRQQKYYTSALGCRAERSDESQVGSFPHKTGWDPSGGAAFVPIRNSRVSPSLLVVNQYRAPAVLASCVRIRRGFPPKQCRSRLCI